MAACAEDRKYLEQRERERMPSRLSTERGAGGGAPSYHP